jgi:hypothetical protein
MNVVENSVRQCSNVLHFLPVLQYMFIFSHVEIYSCGLLPREYLLYYSRYYALFMLFGVQIVVRYHSGEILPTLSQLRIEVGYLCLEYITLKYYNICFCSGGDAKTRTTVP